MMMMSTSRPNDEVEGLEQGRTSEKGDEQGEFRRGEQNPQGGKNAEAQAQPHLEGQASKTRDRLPQAAAAAQNPDRPSLRELETQRMQIRKRIQNWTDEYIKVHGVPPSHHDKRVNLRKDYDDYLRISSYLKTGKKKKKASRSKENVERLNAKVHQMVDGLEDLEVEDRQQENLPPSRKQGASLPDLSETPSSIEDVILEVVGELDAQAVSTEVADLFDEEAALASVDVLHVPEDQMRRRMDEAARSTRREAQARADEYEKRELDLVWRELSVRRRLKAMESDILTTGKSAAMVHEKRAMEKERTARRRATQIFANLRAVLSSALNTGTEDVANIHRVGDAGQDGGLGPRYVALKIRVNCLRAVRSKLPRGTYSILVRVFDQLGGLPLKGTAAVSRKVPFHGLPTDERMAFDHVVELQLPRPARSTDVIVLEILKVSDSETARVVGWTTLPACGRDFQWVEGSFRLPVHRGETNYSISRYWDFEHAYSENLDRWLANLYIQVQRIPHVEHQPSSSTELLSKDARRNSAESPPSGEQIHPTAWKPSESDVHLEAFTMSLQGSSGTEEDAKTIGGAKLWRRKTILLRDEFRLAWKSMVTENYRQLYSWCTGVLALWTSLYIHFFSQVVYLMANRVPVTAVHMSPFHVGVEYPQSGMHAQTEIGLVAVGPLGVCTIFGFTILFLEGIRRWSPHLLASFDTFMLFFGLAAVLDPVTILLVDLFLASSCGAKARCGSESEEKDCACTPGDWLKLAVRMNDEGSTWFVGALYTLSLYAGSSMIALALFYVYMTTIFRNGRALDTYRRLFSPEAVFFLPRDHEVSLQAFQQACRTSETFHGPHGERRVVVACDYNFLDPTREDGLSQLETSTQVAIYNLDRTGARSLWRQFYRTHDGSVLEVDSHTDRDLEMESMAISSALGLVHPGDDPAPARDRSTHTHQHHHAQSHRHHASAPQHEQQQQREREEQAAEPLSLLSPDPGV